MLGSYYTVPLSSQYDHYNIPVALGLSWEQQWKTKSRYLKTWANKSKTIYMLLEICEIHFGERAIWLYAIAAYNTQSSKKLN